MNKPQNNQNHFIENLIIWKLTIILCVIFDQCTKYIARENLPFNQSIEVIPKVLDWKLLFNTGAAFSFLNDQTFLLTIVSATVSIGLIIYSLKTLSEAGRLKSLFLAFLISGAVGNLIDRILFQKVTDFIDLLILPGDFPVFNFADVYINLAVGLLICDWALSKR